MNIFILDESPIIAARVQHDRHVVKMILESAQMLSVACHLNGDFMSLVERHHLDLLYKPTHPNHPCSIWAREAPANFAWLTIHASALVGEYHHRFRKYHATYPVILAFQQVACKLAGVERFWTRDADRNLIIDPAVIALAESHTPFVYAGPIDFQQPNVIDSYRDYYLAQKVRGNRWSNPSLPLPLWLAPHAILFDRYSATVREVTKPHVPTGMAIPSFLRNLIK